MLSQWTSATPLVILAIATLVSLAKPYLEASFLPVTAPLHDTTIRLAAVLLGAVVVIAATLLSGAVATGPVVFNALVEGSKAGLLAIVSYHLLTGSLFDSTSPLPLPVAAAAAPKSVPVAGPAPVLAPAVTPPPTTQPSPAVATPVAPLAPTEPTT